MAEKIPELLIAEDDPQSVRLLCDLLQAAGYHCRAVTDGEAIMAAVESMRPDLILLDVRIPGRNGFEVCEELKANPHTAHIPIVMVTAYTEEHWRLRAMEAGADDFLTKPVKRAELYARIRSLLRLRRCLAEQETADSVVGGLFAFITLHDPELARHSQAVSTLATAAAQHAGMDSCDVRMLKMAGLLHDLGKVPGSGENDQSHPLWGEEILIHFGHLSRLAPLIRGHHEHFDGSGFPDGTSGANQSPLLQLLAAANAWEHILSDADNLSSATAELQRQIDLGWWNPAFKDPLVKAVGDLAQKSR